MRIRHNDTPIPHSFARHPAAKGRLVHEFDLPVEKGSKLRAKVLIFKHKTALQQFWKKAMPNGWLGRSTEGVVTKLSFDATRFDHNGETSYRGVDPRYFCVVGLHLKALTAEVLAHEAAHVGFAYAHRKPKMWWIDEDEFEEERICYPTGIFFHLLIDRLHRLGVLPD